jgi:hypothetical protein
MHHHDLRLYISLCCQLIKRCAVFASKWSRDIAGVNFAILLN